MRRRRRKGLPNLLFGNRRRKACPFRGKVDGTYQTPSTNDRQESRHERVYHAASKKHPWRLERIRSRAVSRDVAVVGKYRGDEELSVDRPSAAQALRGVL